MAALATQVIVPGGLNPAYAAAAGGGDTFAPDKDTYVHVKNGGGGSITVTIPTPGTSRGFAVGDAGGSVPNGAERIFGPFPADAFTDPTTGTGSITYSGVTSVTVGVFKAQEY